MSALVRPGRGSVPATGSLLEDALKGLCEVAFNPEVLTHAKMHSLLHFSERGCSYQEVKAFVDELLGMDGAEEPVVQSGNIYGVSDTFHDINGELIMHAFRTGDTLRALSEVDQKRALAIVELLVCNTNLRNRNPLHPSVVDAAIIGNLLNFPKHVFGLPFAAFASDGNEALSLLLFSYRQERLGRADQTVLLVGDAGESLPDIRHCATRLGLELIEMDEAGLASGKPRDRRPVAVVACLGSSSLGEAAAWAERHAGGLHVHVTDTQLRKLFTESPSPVHLELPRGVRSVSIEEGLLNCGYTLYRDTTLRDLHMDVPCEWQTVYASPNEGGSCTGRPLMLDFCTFVLGWAAVADIARGAPALDRSQYDWQPIRLAAQAVSVDEGVPVEQVLQWAKTKMEPGSSASREELEGEVISFQQEFMGGRGVEVEGMTTGGGTRSINCAFEAVMARDEAHGRPGPRLRVLTGNPHVAVERAARRFGFELIRLDVDGAICVDQLRDHISDPCVTAVYTQSLSYTDGISDALAEVLAVVEAENKARAAKEGVPVVVINDSCLAFSVLVHNDGEGGSRSMRLLDLAEGCITPVIVTQDAHKHLGVDKGLSTVVGTHRILSALQGSRRVGARPGAADLVRALANMKLLGKQGYVRLYRELGERIAEAVSAIEAGGMKVIHAHNRMPGSTVIAVEDPSGAVAPRLKKKGYSTMPIFLVRSGDPAACQTGWQLSLSPHHLRPVKRGKSALVAFTEDLVPTHRAVQGTTLAQLSRRFLRENSLLAFLAAGNPDPFLFQLLRKEGLGRKFVCLIIRRCITAQLDSGTVCTLKRRDPVWQLACRGSLCCLLLSLLATLFRRLAALRRTLRSR